MNPKIINFYQLHLQESLLKPSTKYTYYHTVYKFFRTMSNWPEMPPTIPIKQKNPWSKKLNERNNSDKIIPEYVIAQLDKIFKEDKLPLHLRTLYWIMRSIPSRVSEVTSMSLDCLKPYGPNYALFIPMWKQNGGHIEPEIRVIHIKDHGHGKYILDLVRQQQKVSRSLQNLLPKDKQNLLFTCYRTKKSLRSDEYMPIIKPGPIIFNSTTAGDTLRKICKRYEIRDQAGIPYNVTSHQLRHNGITDRIEEGFELIEIRDMTGHKGDAMPSQSYYHPNPEKLLKKQKELLIGHEGAVASLTNPPVYFRGRIMNLEPETEQWIMKNPRAYKIGDGDRCLGYCTDILSCRKGAFECLGCDEFVPNLDEMKYFEEGVAFWESKVKECKLKGFKLYQENAEYNLALHRHIVNRIKLVFNDLGGS